MMRMADALEILTRDFERMKKDLDYYKDLCVRRMERITELENKLKAERGHKTRYKNKITELNQRVTDLELEKADLLDK